MKPVDQAILDDAPGARSDCFRACVASVLELARDEVPHFFDYEEPSADAGLAVLEEWLRRRSLSFTILILPAPLPADLRYFVRGHYIQCGRVFGGETVHAVVGAGGEQVHDPNPLRRGVRPYADDTFALYLITTK